MKDKNVKFSKKSIYTLILLLSQLCSANSNTYYSTAQFSVRKISITQSHSRVVINFTFIHWSVQGMISVHSTNSQMLGESLWLSMECGRSGVRWRHEFSVVTCRCLIQRMVGFVEWIAIGGRWWKFLNFSHTWEQRITQVRNRYGTSILKCFWGTHFFLIDKIDGLQNQIM